MSKVIKKDNIANESYYKGKLIDVFSIDNFTSLVSLLSRWNDSGFKVIDSEKIQALSNDMHLINEKTHAVGKFNSQIQRKVASLQMLYPATATFQVIKEVLALIENRRQALKSNYFRLEKNKIKLKEKELKLKEEEQRIEKLKKKNLELYNIKKELVELKKEKLLVEITELKANISDSIIYVENAIKEIGFLTNTLKEILKNKGLEDLDEYDFEKEEFNARIQLVFREAFKDLIATGKINMGTLEGFETIGIHPLMGAEIATKYFNYCLNELKEGKDLTYEDFHKWLLSMTDEFKENYKSIYKAMGIDTHIDTEYVYIRKDKKKDE